MNVFGQQGPSTERVGVYGTSTWFLVQFAEVVPLRTTPKTWTVNIHVPFCQVWNKWNQYSWRLSRLGAGRTATESTITISSSFFFSFSLNSFSFFFLSFLLCHISVFPNGNMAIVNIDALPSGSQFLRWCRDAVVTIIKTQRDQKCRSWVVGSFDAWVMTVKLITMYVVVCRCIVETYTEQKIKVSFHIKPSRELRRHAVFTNPL
jgi:hypothetical protein